MLTTTETEDAEAIETSNGRYVPHPSFEEAYVEDIEGEQTVTFTVTEDL